LVIYGFGRLSPDGKRLASGLLGDRDNRDIWVLEFSISFFVHFSASSITRLSTDLSPIAAVTERFINAAA
jgi:hypothetical protein